MASTGDRADQRGDNDFASLEAHQSFQQPPSDEYDPGGGDGERGIIGDTYRKFRGKSPQKPGESSGLGHFVFGKLHEAVHDIGSEFGKHFEGKDRPAHQPNVSNTQTHQEQLASPSNRFGSFAAPRNHNDIKWFVDGCGYMWAVSLALERARESIWILDCERRCVHTIFDPSDSPHSQGG